MTSNVDPAASATPSGTKDFVPVDGLPFERTLTNIGIVRSASLRSLPTIKGFTIKRRLGHGGMGEVFEAVDSLDVTYALKMIRVDRFSERALERFRREARAMIDLDHPNIARIYSFGQTGQNEPYFTMKLLRGGSLSDRARDYLAKPRQAVALMIAVADAVHYLHGKGLIHRDLKPQNILLDEHSKPYVSDFGLVRDFDELFTDEGLLECLKEADTADDLVAGETIVKKYAPNKGTLTAGAVGTLPYISPEQLLNHRERIGPQTDVWALGVILYELLCGSRPFESADPASLSDLIKLAAPTPLILHDPSLDPGIEKIVLKCLAKQPEQRYATAAEFSKALKEWADPPPVAMPAPSRGSRKPLIAAACATLLILAGLVAWMARKDRSATLPEKETEQTRLKKSRDEMRAKLQRGEIIDLVGATGEPLLPVRFSIGGEAVATYLDKVDETWTVETLQTAFLEVLDDPGIERYQFEVQLRDNSRNHGRMGLYFAHQDHRGADGSEGHYHGKYVFQEDRPTPPGAKEVGMRTITCDYFGRLPDGHDFERSHSTMFADTYFPTSARKTEACWHLLRIDASPEDYRFFWQGERIFTLPRELTPRLRENLPKMALPPIVPQIDFSPRKPFGICVQMGSVSLRAVRILPLNP